MYLLLIPHYTLIKLRHIFHGPSQLDAFTLLLEIGDIDLGDEEVYTFVYVGSAFTFDFFLDRYVSKCFNLHDDGHTSGFQGIPRYTVVHPRVDDSFEDIEDDLRGSLSLVRLDLQDLHYRPYPQLSVSCSQRN